MTSRFPCGIVAPMTALSVLLSQVLVTTQVSNARPAFEEATVAGIDPSMRNYDRRQLTTTTLLDRTDLLQLIVSAYLDADGAGACRSQIFVCRAPGRRHRAPAGIPIHKFSAKERVSVAPTVDASAIVGGDVRS
jgi:hypothetical protein